MKKTASEYQRQRRSRQEHSGGEHRDVGHDVRTRVGLLDVDLHGLSIPTMLGLEGRLLAGDEEGMIPVEIGGLKVMSVGFILESPDSPVVWRGPLKTGAIRQFIEEVNWGCCGKSAAPCPACSWSPG